MFHFGSRKIRLDVVCSKTANMPRFWFKYAALDEKNKHSIQIEVSEQTNEIYFHTFVTSPVIFISYISSCSFKIFNCITYYQCVPITILSFSYSITYFLLTICLTVYRFVLLFVWVECRLCSGCCWALHLLLIILMVKQNR